MIRPQPSARRSAAPDTAAVVAWLSISGQAGFPSTLMGAAGIRLLAIACVLVTGCVERRAEPRPVNVTIRNESGRSLDWVRLEWTGPYVPGGIIPPGAEKSALGVQWPNLRSATLSFVDDETRVAHRAEVDFSHVNQRVATGECGAVVIAVDNAQAATVRCQ